MKARSSSWLIKSKKHSCNIAPFLYHASYLQNSDYNSMEIAMRFWSQPLPIDQDHDTETTSTRQEKKHPFLDEKCTGSIMFGFLVCSLHTSYINKNRYFPFYPNSNCLSLPKYKMDCVGTLCRRIQGEDCLQLQKAPTLLCSPALSPPFPLQTLCPADLQLPPLSASNRGGFNVWFLPSDGCFWINWLSLLKTNNISS